MRPYGKQLSTFCRQHHDWVMRVPDGARAEVEQIIRLRVEKLTGLACLGGAIDFLDVTRPGGIAKYTLKGVRPERLTRSGAAPG